MNSSIILVVMISFPRSTYGMEKETHHESRFSYSKKGQRSPKVSKALSVFIQPRDLELPTPHNSPEASISFSGYQRTGQSIIIPITPETTLEQQVNTECTKLKLVLLASVSALISAGVTAAITYLNSSCN